MINNSARYPSINYGRPEWRPFWYIQYEPSRNNEMWEKYHKSAMCWPMKCNFTSDPSHIMRMWKNFTNRHTPSKSKMWKKLYIGRRESEMFPMEWRLLYRVPADINDPPDDFDPSKDIVDVDEIDMDTDEFLLPPDREYSLVKLNSEKP